MQKSHRGKGVSSKSHLSHGQLCPRSGQSVATAKGSKTQSEGAPGGRSRGQKVELKGEPQTAEQGCVHCVLSKG